MNRNADDNGDDGANGVKKRSFSEMASSQEQEKTATRGGGNGDVSKPPAKNEDQLAWELLRVVVRLNEENSQRQGQASTNAASAPAPSNSTRASYANSSIFNNSNSNNVNGQAQAPGIDQMISNHQPLWSQVPLINCLAVLLVLQRLEQVQAELNQQASQFQQMSQLLSGILGQQFRLPFPTQPSLMDCILASCQRDPASLLGALVAGLFTTSQRQQEQQRMMQSLQQQITASLFQQVQQPASYPPFPASHPQFSPSLQAPKLNLTGQNREVSLQAAIQQIFQQQPPPLSLPAASVPQTNQGTATLSELLRVSFGNQQDPSSASPSLQSPQLRGNQNGGTTLQAAIQQMIQQQQQPAAAAAPAPQVSQGTATLDTLLGVLFANQEESSSTGTSPLIAALLQMQQQQQQQGQEKRASSNSVFEDDSEDVSDSDDISLGEDSYHRSNSRINNFVHVPEFVNIPHNPWKKGRANQKPQVHVVPTVETVEAVFSATAGNQDNSKQNQDPSKAIMPPPRQDMEMVSSLSDAEQHSDTSTASSLTMRSIRSTAA